MIQKKLLLESRVKLFNQIAVVVHTIQTTLNSVISRRCFAESGYERPRIDHFTVVSLVTWPLNGSEAGVDLVLIKTSLLLLCKSSCSYAN